MRSTKYIVAAAAVANVVTAAIEAPSADDLKSNTFYCNQFTSVAGSETDAGEGYAAITINGGHAFGTLHLTSWSNNGAARLPEFDTNADPTNGSGILAHVHADTCANQGGGHWKKNVPVDESGAPNYLAPYDAVNEFWFRLFILNGGDRSSDTYGDRNVRGWFGSGSAAVSVDTSDETFKSIVIHRTDAVNAAGDKSICCDLLASPDNEESPEVQSSLTAVETPTIENLDEENNTFYCDEFVDINTTNVPEPAEGYAAIVLNSKHAYGSIRLSSWGAATDVDITVGSSPKPLDGKGNPKYESGILAHVHDKACEDSYGGDHWQAAAGPAHEENEFWFRLFAGGVDGNDTNENYNINKLGWFGAGSTALTIDPEDTTFKSIVVHKTLERNVAGARSVCCNLKRAQGPQAPEDEDVGMASFVRPVAAATMTIAAIVVANMM